MFWLATLISWGGDGSGQTKDRQGVKVRCVTVLLGCAMTKFVLQLN